jgi:hypothetical protein
MDSGEKGNEEIKVEQKKKMPDRSGPIDFSNFTLPHEPVVALKTFLPPISATLQIVESLFAFVSSRLSSPFLFSLNNQFQMFFSKRTLSSVFFFFFSIIQQHRDVAFRFVSRTSGLMVSFKSAKQELSARKRSKFLFFNGSRFSIVNSTLRFRFWLPRMDELIQVAIKKNQNKL